MKIYTKKGDQGQTSLIGGKRVAKNDIQIEAYGTVDELNSWIGLIRDDNAEMVDLRTQLLEIQDRLFTIGSLLAVAEDGTKMQLPELHASDISYLENAIDSMNENLAPMTSFVLPGGHVAVSHCHIARCVCRRAERLVVALQQVQPKFDLVLQYLNRLSDYLFVLSRKLTLDLKANEIPWKPRM
jgi:cob(I)alamin adenosyltransferase